MDEHVASREARVIDFARRVAALRGVGFEQMRRLRIGDRRGYIACTRQRLGQELAETQDGRREPHW